MLRVRGAAPFASGMTVTGFWLGITVGGVVLGFVTPRFGERISVIAYLVLAMGLELLSWLVPQSYVSAVTVGFLGFILGPLFPAVVVAATKILPKRMHVGSIGFSAALGGSGAAACVYLDYERPSRLTDKEIGYLSPSVPSLKTRAYKSCSLSSLHFLSCS